MKDLQTVTATSKGKRYSKKTIKLSNAFSAILNEWIPEKLAEVNRLNKEHAGDNCCATHDFCDPNQAMIDAFKSLFGKEPTGRNREQNYLIDNAWELSKTNGFKI